MSSAMHNNGLIEVRDEDWCGTEMMDVMAGHEPVRIGWNDFDRFERDS